MGVVHSSTDSNFLQEVEKLVKQEKESKDDEKKRDVQQQLQLKTLERDLACAKWVRINHECYVELNNRHTSVHYDSSECL